MRTCVQPVSRIWARTTLCGIYGIITMTALLETFHTIRSIWEPPTARAFLNMHIATCTCTLSAHAPRQSFPLHFRNITEHMEIHDQQHFCTLRSALSLCTRALHSRSSGTFLPYPAPCHHHYFNTRTTNSYFRPNPKYFPQLPLLNYFLKRILRYYQNNHQVGNHRWKPLFRPLK